MLTRLCLASSDCERLKLFLEQRAGSFAKEKGPRILDYLELATAKKDVHVLEDIVSQHIDMSCIAKSSLAAEWHGRWGKRLSKSRNHHHRTHLRFLSSL